MNPINSKKKAYLIIVLSLAAISFGVTMIGSAIVSNDSSQAFSFFSRASTVNSSVASRTCLRCDAGGGATRAVERFERYFLEAQARYASSSRWRTLSQVFLNEYAFSRAIRDDTQTVPNEIFLRYCNFAGSRTIGARVFDTADIEEYNRLCLSPTPTVFALPSPQPTAQPPAYIISSQKEAESNQRETVIEPTKTSSFKLCDVNKDGVVNFEDVQLLSYCIATFEYRDCISLDTNRDGKVDAGDDSARTLCRLSPNNATEFFCDPNRDGVNMDAADYSYAALSLDRCMRIPTDQQKCIIDPNKDGVLNIDDILYCKEQVDIIFPTVPSNFNLQACDPYIQTPRVTAEDIELIEEFIRGNECKYADLNADGKIDAGDSSAASMCALGGMSAFANCRYLDFNKDGVLDAVERSMPSRCIYSQEREEAVRLLERTNAVVPDCNNDGTVDAGDVSAAIIVMHSY